MCSSVQLMLFLVLQTLEIFATAQNCSLNVGCLRCGRNGCTKCVRLITYPERRCVDACPRGYRSQWSTYSDYMGRVCVERVSFMGLPSDGLTILAGIVCGSVLCFLVVAAAVLYIQYKKKLILTSSETSSEIEESTEHREFVKQLEILRPYANTFLDILNDTRRELRESHNLGDNNAVAIYKPVIRDLAKILILLNRPIEKLSTPDEWENLFHWAEKTLKRCKRVSQVSQPQVAQLINFLQSPVEVESGRNSTTMSTFKPDQVYGSSSSLHNVTIAAIRSFDENYDTNLNPQWKFDFYPSSQFNPILWKNSKENVSQLYFSDDDFLGFRPQDEITTEL